MKSLSQEKNSDTYALLAAEKGTQMGEGSSGRITAVHTNSNPGIG